MASPEDFRYSRSLGIGDNRAVHNPARAINLKVSSEQSRVTTHGLDFGIPLHAPNLEPQVANQSLCCYCAVVARDSKIVHQPPKIDWHSELPVVYLPRKRYEPPIGHPTYEAFKHHKTIGALKESAKQCDCCALLYAFDPEYPDPSQVPDSTRIFELRVLRADSHDRGPGLLIIKVKGLSKTGATYLMDGAPHPAMNTTLKYLSTDHDEVLQLAKRWLDTCLTKHESCMNHEIRRDDYTLPTRLIKVTGSGSNVFPMWLCSGKELPAQTKYLTLSHCWGGINDICKLTEANLSQFHRSIPVAQLPKNFYDAAVITLRLGYTYLWIDSLCIIPDQASGDDWKMEAANMGNVYRNSVCTIAAIGAKNPHDGCFSSRDPRSFAEVQLVANSTTKTGIWAENWRIQDPNAHISRVTPVLNTRGWVVQERALSLRTLSFGAEMIFWECPCMAASEEDQGMRPREGDFHVKSGFFNLLENAEQGPRDRMWQETWWRIIQAYTRCNLSFSSDRWPAISGVLSLIEKHCNSRLIYGLWEVNLAEELLWEVVTPRKQSRVDNDTPSWSWLSIEAEVNKMWFNFDTYFRMDAKVRKCFRLDTRTSRTKGPAKLVVRARMAKLKWGIGYYGDGRRDYKFRLHDDSRSQKGAWDGLWSPDLLPNEAWETWALQYVVDDNVQEAAGLVVRPDDLSKNNNWVRVGAYTLMPQGGGEDDSHWNIGEIKTISLI